MSERHFPSEMIQMTEERKQALMAFNQRFTSLSECSTTLQRFGFPHSHVLRWSKTDRIKRLADRSYWCCIHPWVSHQCLLQILSVEGMSAFQDLATLSSIPIMLLVADEGSASSKEGIEAMKQVCPKMRVEFIPGSGHSIHRTNTDEFIALIEDFYQSTLKKLEV